MIAPAFGTGRSGLDMIIGGGTEGPRLNPEPITTRRLPNLHNPNCYDAIRSGLLPESPAPISVSPSPPAPDAGSGPTFFNESGRANRWCLRPAPNADIEGEH